MLALLLACVGGNITATDLNTDDTAIGTDADGDGFGAEDCDDSNPDIFPGAEELCDGVDQDCDGEIDESATDADTYYPDADGDGYGDPASLRYSCEALEDYVTNSDDCDDTDSAVNPGAQEVCDPDQVDEDCNGLSDDGDEGVDASTTSTYYADADGDGYGDPDTSMGRCSDSSDWVIDDTDCDDTNPLATPLNECDIGWLGVYTGDFEIVADSSALSDTCTGTAELTVDSAGTPVAAGTFDCTWTTLASLATVTAEGDWTGDDSLAGTMTVGDLNGVEWTGDFTEPGTLTATGVGIGDVYGVIEVDYVLTMNLSR